MRLKTALLITSHMGFLGAGFALGIYALPVLIAPSPPAAQALQQLAESASYRARFERDLPGSDFLHWGEGNIAVGPDAISHRGKLAPGPDYQLYLSPVFVNDEASVLDNKGHMLRVGPIHTFDGFVVDLPEGVDIEQFNTVVVWCETFSQFISSAQYR